MDKELDLSCWTKFAVLETRQAYLIVLKIQLDNMTAPTLKMLVSLVLQVTRLLTIKYCRQWLLSACAYNSWQQGNMPVYT